MSVTRAAGREPIDTVGAAQFSALRVRRVRLSLIRSEMTNVIPAEAAAELDVRLRPGKDPEVFIQQLRRRIGDHSIKVEACCAIEQTR
jgi:acetylornithine deacetylase/succinyl-diaminopimelate desuccinylase-like protein